MNSNPVRFTGKRRTPLTAIRAYCLWCCGNSSREVELCPSTDCALYFYRLGKIPAGASRRLLKVIRSRCLECVDGPGEVTRCAAHEAFAGQPPCPLWLYRFGRNPNISEKARTKRRKQGLMHGFKPKTEQTAFDMTEA